MSPQPPFPLRKASSGPGALEPQDLWPGLAVWTSAQLPAVSDPGLRSLCMRQFLCSRAQPCAARTPIDESGQ